MAETGGPPKFAESVADLYYTERDGSPLAFIPKVMADANSPETAVYGYYFTSLTADVKGSINPLVDFAICATPVDERCPILIVRAAYYGSGSVTWKSSRDAPTNTRAPISVFPDIPSDRKWIPINFPGYVDLQGPGIAVGSGCQVWTGSVLRSGKPPLTSRELEAWLNEVRDSLFPHPRAASFRFPWE